MTAPLNLALQPAGTVTHDQICLFRQSATILAHSRRSALSLVDHGGSALRQRPSAPKATSRRIIPRDPLSILCPNRKPQQPNRGKGRPVVTPEGAITATSPAIQPHRLRCDPLCMGRTCKQAAGPGGLRCRIPDRAGDSLGNLRLRSFSITLTSSNRAYPCEPPKPSKDVRQDKTFGGFFFPAGKF